MLDLFLFLGFFVFSGRRHHDVETSADEGEVSVEVVVADVAALGLRLDVIADPWVVLSDHHHCQGSDYQSWALTRFAEKGKQPTEDQKHSH